MADDTTDSDGAAVGDPGVGAASASRWTWRRWLKIVGLVVVVAILAVEVTLVWPHLARAWSRIGEIHWWWIGACVLAVTLSMDAPAQVQRVLMRSAGVQVPERESLAVILASNSISQTMPGGQVLAPAFIYRESRKWGATPVVASWQLVMSGLFAGVGLALVGFGGALIAGAKTSPFSVFFSVAAFVIVLVVMQYLAGHPEALEGIGRQALDWVNSLRRKPARHGYARLHRILDQLRAVKLRRRDGALAFGWSLFNWIADVACLAFACYAIGVEPSIASLMVAYAAGKAAGSAMPLLPGGLGVVEVVMWTALATAGTPFGDAVMAVIIYRVISFLLVAVIGWVVIGFRYRHAISSRDDLRNEMEREEGAEVQNFTDSTRNSDGDDAPDSTAG